MTDAWRMKRYYEPRVLLDVDDILTPLFGDCLVCLTGSELYVLRNLTQYLHRRSTFVSSYHQGYYLAPDNQEWDDLQAIVAGLEDKLMNCEEFTQQLEDILAAAQCACNKAAGTGSIHYDPYDGNQEDAFTLDDTLPDAEMEEQYDPACAIAQLWYQWGYEVITEYILPATEFTYDVLLALIAAFVGAATGGVGVAIGFFLFAELVQQLMEGAYDAAQSNIVNWLESAKVDIVCNLWLALLEGGDAQEIWQSCFDQIVDPAEDLSALDKVMINLAMGAWAGTNAKAAYDAATDWATGHVIEEYCLACPQPPIIGSDWWALHVGGPDFYVRLNAPPPPDWWAYAKINYDVIPSQTLVGIIFSIDREDTCNGLSCWAGCTYYFTLDSSDNFVDGNYMACNKWEFNETEAKAELDPTCSILTWDAVKRTGPITTCFGWKIEHQCSGYVDIQVNYLIYKGTSPP
jgi:hypothetical protein